MQSCHAHAKRECACQGIWKQHISGSPKLQSLRRHCRAGPPLEGQKQLLWTSLLDSMLLTWMALGKQLRLAAFATIDRYIRKPVEAIRSKRGLLQYYELLTLIDEAARADHREHLKSRSLHLACSCKGALRCLIAVLSTVSPASQSHMPSQSQQTEIAISPADTIMCTSLVRCGRNPTSTWAHVSQDQALDLMSWRDLQDSLAEMCMVTENAQAQKTVDMIWSKYSAYPPHPICEGCTERKCVPLLATRLIARHDSGNI